MTPAIGLAAAMSDPQLLGGPFQQDSFWSWLTVAKSYWCLGVVWIEKYRSPAEGWRGAD